MTEKTHPAELEAIASLVTQVRDGDVRAFNLLVGRLQPQVFRWALTYAFDPDDAEDITQEAFVSVYRHIRQFRGDSSLHVWLYQIVRRAASQLRRKRNRRALLAATAKAQPDRTTYTTDPGGRVDRERLSATVRLYWEELPERQREVLDLVDLQGYAPSEAAAMLGLENATLRANLFKARQSLRGRLLAAHPDLARTAT